MSTIVGEPASLILPPQHKLIVPTQAPISCGRTMPSGGPAYDLLRKVWLFRIIQWRMMLCARLGLPFVFAVAPPGTGKTAGQLFYFWELLAMGKVRYLFLIVPNMTLVKAAQDAVKSYLGPNYTLQVADNKRDRLDPEDQFCLGVVATYQTLNQPDAAARWIDRLRKACDGARRVGRSGGVLFACDEGHHLADTREQIEANDPTNPALVETSSFRPWCAIPHALHKAFVVEDGGYSLITTGTPDRDDHYMIPLVTFCDESVHDPDKNPACAGTVKFDLDEVSDHRSGSGPRKVPHIHVACSYAEAYAEGSLKLLVPLRCPAEAKYKERGKKRATTNRTDNEDLTNREIRDSIFTANSKPRYWQSTAKKTVNDWNKYRKATFDIWRLLGICHDQEMAADVGLYLRNELGVNAGLAISGSGDEHGKKAMATWVTGGGPVESGHEALEKFKVGKYEALLTVAMAYEGYDVPEISHIMFLTNYRTKTFCIQAFTRGCRVCYEAVRRGMKPHEQICYVAMAADNLAMGHLKRIQEGLLVSAAATKYLVEPEERDEVGAFERRIKPIRAKLIHEPARRIVAANSAELDDVRRMNDLKTWTRGATGLNSILNKRHPGWRGLKGEKLLAVWSFVKAYVK